LSKGSPFAGKARDNLLSRVASMHETPQPQPAVPGHVQMAGKQFTDFATLPGYDELRLQRAIGERLKLDNPYFRMHDGLAGARTEIGGRTYLNFSCYDYLGLNGHPEITAAAKGAIDRYGISCSASRHVAGERPVHRALEETLAAHYGCEDALVFVSGYGTNVGAIGQLVGAKDLVVFDAVVHNSAVTGAQLSGASRRSFAHNDLDQLEQILSSSRGRFERVLIVVEGLYSMDGDFPDLPRLIALKNRYHAWLMIDEAHALGVLGRRGYGIAEHFGVDPGGVDIWMGTLSKTLVGCGGYIAGSAVLVDYLRCMAGAYVYSVGMPPLIAAATRQAIEIMHRETERVVKLQANASHFHQYARTKGLDTGMGRGTAICPVIVGDSIPTVMLSQQLFDRGINVLPVLYPAVPAKSGRLRYFITALHSKDDIETAVDTTVEELARIPARMRAIELMT
jgi:8-amino-7-oxononanoate synthase